MKKKVTETEFLQWLRTEKNIDIAQSSTYSAMGKLSDVYKTEDGCTLVYGLSVYGMPPHLDLSTINIVQYVQVGKITQLGYSHNLKSKVFYSKGLSNEERYLLLNKEISVMVDGDMNILTPKHPQNL